MKPSINILPVLCKESNKESFLFYQRSFHVLVVLEFVQVDKRWGGHCHGGEDGRWSCEIVASEKTSLLLDP